MNYNSISAFLEVYVDKLSRFTAKLPGGTEGLFQEEAFVHQKVLQAIQELFNSWGYLPVQTPVFDFYDIYSRYIPADSLDKVYRLVDREGDLLMLRSDITLFLARSLGLTLREGHKPLRVSYGDSILRHQDQEDVSANEFFQIGAEFVGSSHPEGDLEIILLLGAVLSLLGLEGARIHVGSRKLFELIFPNLQGAALTRALQGVETRDTPYLGGVLGPRAALLPLVQFMGTPEEARQTASRLKAAAPAKIFTQEIEEEWEALCLLVETLKELGRDDGYCVDGSEVGRQSYYTGLVFRAYTPSLGDALASGGRYDKLLGNFGLDTPSVGFSLHLRKITALIGQKERFGSLQPLQSTGKTFKERYRAAEILRKSGKPAVI